MTREGADVDLMVVALVLSWVVTGLVGAITFFLLRQYGRILLELDSLTQPRQPEDAAVPPTRVPVGIPAPAFKLPRLEGGELALDEFRGRRVLLVFSDPQCEACEALVPTLEQLHRRHFPRLAVLMVSRGDPRANRAQVARYGLTFPIGLEQHREISREYGTLEPPVAYLVDERSVIASEAAVSVEAILALATQHAPP